MTPKRKPVTAISSLRLPSRAFSRLVRALFFFAAPALLKGAPLTNVAQVLALSPAVANQSLEVRCEGMVTFHWPSARLLFVQDATGGIFVDTDEAAEDARPGEWVEARGVTGAGRYSRVVTLGKIKRVPAREPVRPRTATLAELAAGGDDAQLVAAEGVARAAEWRPSGELVLTLADSNVTCRVLFHGLASNAVPRDLVDSRVRVTGVCLVDLGPENKVQGAILWGRSLDDIGFVAAAPSEGSIPISRVADLLARGAWATPVNRIRVRGSITYRREALAYLQDESGAIPLETSRPLAKGNNVDVVGFLEWVDSVPLIRDARLVASIRPAGGGAGKELSPVEITAPVLVSGRMNFSLVKVTATVVQYTAQPDAEQLTCQDGDTVFVAELKGRPPSELAKLARDTEVELTGLVIARKVPGETVPMYKLELESAADARIIRAPPWWTVGRAFATLAIVLGALALAGAWISSLRLRVARQTALIRAQFDKEVVLDAQFGELVSNANDFVYTHDLEGNFTSVNEACQRLLGYRPDEMVRMNFEHILQPESLKVAMEMLGRMRADGGRTTYELQAVAKLGRRVDLEVSSWMVYREGKPFAVQGIARDISARRRAEKAMRDSEQKYRDVVECSQDLIWSVNIAGRWTFINQAARRVYGCDPNDLIGRPVSELESESGAGSMGRLLAGLDGLDTVRFEAAHRRADGTSVLLSFQAIVSRDATGQITGLTGSARDITQQKRDQENILRLAAAVQQASDIVAILDTGGVVQYVNPAFERVSGFSAPDAMDNAIVSLLVEGAATPSFLEIAATVSRTGFWSGTLRIRQREQGAIETEATVSSIKDDAGQVINYACVFRDVSRETRLAEQVRRSQKMEAIGLLAGGVAHDFNNLVQVIDGFAALALRSLDDPAACREHLEKALSATRRAAQLTRQLLAFGRRQTLLTEDVDLNDLVADHLRMVQRLIGAHIEVEIFPQPAIDNVRVDRGQLEQVLLNLCINARDAMPGGGRLTVELHNVTLTKSNLPSIGESRPGRFVRFTVRDTGTGMDKATLQRIFDPFFTTKPTGKGTGLGLAVVYGIIEQHGGFLDVVSAPGAGSEFSVYLPVAERTDRAGTRATALAVVSGDETLLLAEDEPLVREIAVRVLQDAGYKVLVAENGLEAVEVFEKHADEVGLLVFDVVMPRLGGPAAFARIREIRPGARVLFCSGYGGSDPLLEKLVAGGVEILDKPYSAQRFLEAVRRALDRSVRATELAEAPAAPGPAKPV
jgi:PAS domain S-box-containing protein